MKFSNKNVEEFSSDETMEYSEIDSQEDCRIIDKIQDENDFELLRSIYSYIFKDVNAIKLLENPKIIKLDETILGISGFINLSNIDFFYNYKVREAIKEMADESSAIFFKIRISNTPLKLVLDAYKKHNVTYKNIIIASEVTILNNREQREIEEDFPECSKEDSKYWPIYSEEFFLNKYKERIKFIDGKKKLKIFKLSKISFIKFLNEFEKEIY